MAAPSCFGMCRMFGFKGPGRLGARLQAALIEAARSDPFSANRSHGDGWGAVLVCGSVLSHHRSVSPIFGCDEAARFFGSCGGAAAGLSHARKAAPGEPVRGAYDSHPFSAHLGGDIVFVAHNGWIDKRRLGLGGLDVSGINDTEAFCLLLEKVFCGGFVDTVEEAISHIYRVGANIGALNLIFLRVPRGGEPELYYYSDHAEEGRELYYTLYVFRGDGGVAVMSSSVAYLAGLVSDRGGALLDGVVAAQKRRLVRLG